MEHPINGLMDTTMKKIKEMVDVNTIIGDPISTPDGTTVIPVSKVTYGFASGGTDFPTKKESKDCFGGGSGAGVTIQPIAFLVVSNGDVRMISVEKYDGAADRVVGMVPDLVDKVTGLFKRDKSAKNAVTDAEAAELEEDIF
ncbi:MAG: GerW family sporulation protein [Ruminococcus sp.]|nr:GerW family sporulation protein [Ruminococcus sp.]